MRIDAVEPSPFVIVAIALGVLAGGLLGAGRPLDGLGVGVLAVAAAELAGGSL